MRENLFPAGVPDEERGLFALCAVGDDFGARVACPGERGARVGADDEISVFVYITGKSVKRLFDVPELFEVVEVLGFDVEDRAGEGVDVEKIVVVLARLGDENLFSACKNVALDAGNNAADVSARIAACLAENRGEHRGGCSLAVDARNRDGLVVVLRDAAQIEAALDHGLFELKGAKVLGVCLPGDGNRINNKSDVVRNVGRIVSDVDFYAQFFEFFGGR